MIHPSAIVDPGARLHESVEVGPWTLIGPDVEIGAGTVIESHVVIKGPTRIGSRNHVYQFYGGRVDPRSEVPMWT